MILLLSSNAARRYGDDIIRALAHPTGTSLQFRYSLDHLDPRLSNRAANNGLVGERALIAFVAADQTASTVTLTSVRLVTIKHTEVVGTSCILSLTAGSYVHPLGDTEVRALLSPTEVALLPAWKGGAHPAGSFAIEMATKVEQIPVATRGAEMTAFEKTAAALGKFTPFKDAVGLAFFAIQRIAAEDAPTWYWFRRDPEPKLDYGRYRLLSGYRYRLDIYSYRPTGSAIATPATKLVVTTDEKAVQFTSAKEAVLDSRYDLNRFDFTTDQLLNDLPAPITIALSVAAGVPPAAELRCDITLLARFEGWRGQAVLRTLLVAAGTASSAIIGVAYKDQFSLGIGLAMCVGPLIAAYVGIVPALRKAA